MRRTRSNEGREQVASQLLKGLERSKGKELCSKREIKQQNYRSHFNVSTSYENSVHKDNDMPNGSERTSKKGMAGHEKRVLEWVSGTSSCMELIRWGWWSRGTESHLKNGGVNCKAVKGEGNPAYWRRFGRSVP